MLKANLLIFSYVVASLFGTTSNRFFHSTESLFFEQGQKSKLVFALGLCPETDLPKIDL